MTERSSLSSFDSLPDVKQADTHLTVDRTGRSESRHFTVSLGRCSEGQFKEPRSHSVPPYSNRRGDFALSKEQLDKLKELQQETTRRSKSSVVEHAVTQAELDACWKDATCHIHGIDKDGQAFRAERQCVHFSKGSVMSFKDAEEQNAFYLSNHSIAFSCGKGCKGSADTSSNQDNFSMTVFGEWTVYTVMDGHGPNGHLVSARTVQSLPYHLTRSEFFPNDMEKALRQAFEMTSKNLSEHAVHENFDIQASGTTCVVGVKSADQLWTAWIGDSRLVLGSLTNPGVRFTTKDHKPEDAAERQRIEESGGECRTYRYDDDWTITRVFVKGQDFPGLCMTRSFGDESVKKCGVTYEPSVEGPMSIGKDDYMILATDGIWEFFTSEWVLKALTKKLAGVSTKPTEVNKVVQKLCKESRKKWREEEGDYCDDITALIVFLDSK